MATLNVDVKANGSLWDRVIQRMKTDMKSFRAIAPKLAAVGAAGGAGAGGFSALRQWERSQEHERRASRLDITGNQFGELENLQAFRPLVGTGVTDTAAGLGELKHRAVKQFDDRAIETLSKISPDWRQMNEGQLMATALQRYPEMSRYSQGMLAGELPAFRDANFRAIAPEAIDRAMAIGADPYFQGQQEDRLKWADRVDRFKATKDRFGRDVSSLPWDWATDPGRAIDYGGRKSGYGGIPEDTVSLSEDTIRKLRDQGLPGDEIN